MTKHENPEGRAGLRARFTRQSVRTRSVVAATGILVVGITATSVAATGSPLLQGKRNGTATQETQVIADIGATNSATGGYSTRQSNLSSTGGGAVYGCRSTTGGSNAVPPTNPCIRANNLSSGFAFEFNASDGTSVGSITAGSGGDTKKPFTTNATGVATGLNADRVDGIDGTSLLQKTEKAADAAKLNGQDASFYAAAGDLLFAKVAAAGDVTASRGLAATAPVTKAGTTYTVTFAKDVSKCSFTTSFNSSSAAANESITASSIGTTKVTVDEATGGTAKPFSLQVIC